MTDIPVHRLPPEPLEPCEGESDPRLALEGAGDAAAPGQRWNRGGEDGRGRRIEGGGDDFDDDEGDDTEDEEPEDGGEPGGGAVAREDQPAGESWWDLTQFLLVVLAVALVVRTFLFQPYNIPSGSMESTLLVGDYLFVDKFAYGYGRYSFPLGRYLPSFGRVLFRDPSRGDVLVFAPPGDPSTVFIKRLVGLPGDRVRMTGGVLYVNDQAVPKRRIADFIDTGTGYEHHIARYRETLPGGKSYVVLDQDPAGPGDDTKTYIVPPGHYFMMGDNRDDSNDSRMDVGYVPAENLVGKALFRFFSIDGEKTTPWKIWTWPLAIRAERIFTVID
jgi:signal peptidase I